MDPIFLHSWWRSSSTYFWLKFRRQSDCLAYYEPLHEGHAVEFTERDDAFFEDGPDGWDSGHPAIGPSGYFQEYRLLYDKRKLPRLAAAEIYGQFLLDPRAACPSVEKHVRVLVDHARRETLRPVLSFVRSFGRIAWLKQRFGGRHVLILRDPIDVWCAMARHQAMADNAFFIPTSLLIASKLALREEFRPLFGPLDLPGIEGAGLPQEKGWIRKIIPWIPPVTAYEVFFTAWVLCLARNGPATDVIIDVGSVHEIEAQGRLNAALANFGLPALDFADWRPPAHETATRRAFLAAELRVVERLSPEDGAALDRFLDGARKSDGDLPTLTRLRSGP
jgi:hypothetical protein